AAIDHMASEGRALGTKMFAHDEDAIEVRRQNRQMGISVSEFPMTEDTADEARDHGEAIILGSPNVLRGGSQNNALDATSAIKQGRCTCLASDYYYPAMMFAAFKLVDEQAMSLPEAWKLISLNAAKA
ncbi:MAG TPA: alpha-D-ribose 1-methylphosphonate 5-triphosphate diphosphatase, partial [Rhizobiales bacterium]|nr:alpha-D-ribose 1-methylphosphonate 5-triphosphate diphosphatase [Hyphomicrobiales bacterium]